MVLIVFGASAFLGSADVGSISKLGLRCQRADIERSVDIMIERQSSLESSHSEELKTRLGDQIYRCEGEVEGANLVIELFGKEEFRSFSHYVINLRLEQEEVEIDYCGREEYAEEVERANTEINSDVLVVGDFVVLESGSGSPSRTEKALEAAGISYTNFDFDFCQGSGAGAETGRSASRV